MKRFEERGDALSCTMAGMFEVVDFLSDCCLCLKWLTNHVHVSIGQGPSTGQYLTVDNLPSTYMYESFIHGCRLGAGMY